MNEVHSAPGGRFNQAVMEHFLRSETEIEPTYIDGHLNFIPETVLENFTAWDALSTTDGR
jgi:hypothetical protein